MRQSTRAALLALVLALGLVAPALAISGEAQGRRLLKKGGAAKGEIEIEIEVEDDSDDKPSWIVDDKKGGFGETYTRDDYEKAAPKGNDDNPKGKDDNPKGNDDNPKGNDDNPKAPAPGPGPGPGPAGPGPVNTPPNGNPGGDDNPKSPGSPGSPRSPGGPIRPPSGDVQPQDGDCVLRGRKYRTCFNLGPDVVVYFTLKDDKLMAGFSAKKSANWAAFILGDAEGAAPAVLAKTCGAQCAKAAGTTAKGGYDIANYKGQSKVKFTGVAAWLTADGTYQVPFTMRWPKGEKSIKFTVARDTAPGARLTKYLTVNKAMLMA